MRSPHWDWDSLVNPAKPASAWVFFIKLSIHKSAKLLPKNSECCIILCYCFVFGTLWQLVWTNMRCPNSVTRFVVEHGVCVHFTVHRSVFVRTAGNFVHVLLSALGRGVLMLQFPARMLLCLAILKHEHGRHYFDVAFIWHLCVFVCVWFEVVASDRFTTVQLFICAVNLCMMYTKAHDCI